MKLISEGLRPRTGHRARFRAREVQCARLEISWARLEATWGRPGGVLGPSWSVLERLGDVLGASWGRLGCVLERRAVPFFIWKKDPKSNLHNLVKKNRFETLF